jgi:cytochrome c oxidase accessory protein FixG
LKTKNIYDLDPERLSTTDEHGHRVYLYPEEVKGKWKNRRSFFSWFLIGLYLVLPWINVNGRPALQVNIFDREFTFLGNTLHGVEPILFFLMLASGLFFIAFLTSLLGRVWCGWACPQTVFIQNIFWKIEQIVEGSARVRRKLAAATWDLNKLIRRALKWILFFIVSAHIAHTFIGYFVGPRVLLQITTGTPSENWGLFTATSILTAIFLLDFGWFREQFCIIACPYGRIQSVMMDENSLVVAYHGNRGEPRLGTVDRGQEGDCVNCYQCVKVCPTGIDIRRGNQLECIQCTLCIDACDTIMDKVKKPRGLISYNSENKLKGKKTQIFTARSILYAVICVSFIAAFSYFLSASSRLNLVFLRSKNPFSVSLDGKVTNPFQLKISHQGSSSPKVEFRLSDPALRDSIQVLTPSHPTLVNSPEKKILILFRFDKALTGKNSRKIKVEAFDAQTDTTLATQEVTLVGPTL